MKLVRLIVLVLLAVVLLGGFVWVSLQPGQIAYTGGSVDVTVQPIAAAVILLGLTFALVLLWALVVWLWALPGKMKRAGEESARRKAMDALGLSLAALDAGEVSEASKQAARAVAAAPDLPGAKLLAAKAAMSAGDPAGAERLLGELLETAGYQVASRRGLAEIAMARGNPGTAVAHADAALLASRKAPWPAEFLFARKVDSHDWEGALAALDDGEKRGLVGAKTAARRRAVVLCAAARRAEAMGDGASAMEMAVRAVKLSPTFAPAVVLSARLQKASGKGWAAAGALESAWEREPHPALALAYRDLKVDEDSAAKGRWMEALVRMNPGHRESRILVAEQALMMGDPVGAAGALDPLIAQGPTSRLLALRAATADAAGDAAGARAWTAKAASAAREPDWSDLDPDGEAFAYEDSDWARLVEAWGDRGVLIHPRLERSDAERLAAPELARVQSAADPTPSAAAVNPDDPSLAAYEGLGGEDETVKPKGWLRF